jgi:hypothetical protein
VNILGIEMDVDVDVDVDEMKGRQSEGEVC